MRIYLFALPFLLTGCIISGGTDPDPCEEDTLLDQEAPSVEYRDPFTGVCTYLGGGGGGGGGGGTCGDWGGSGDEAPAEPQAPGAFADWAVCYQTCEGLDEQSCLTTSACRAAYAIDPGGSQSFYECWGTAPSGPIQGGDCTALDAFACSLHDDCSAVHEVLEGVGDNGGFQLALGNFQNCIAEPGNPSDPGTCTGEILCDALVPDCPDDTVAGRKDGCYTGYCIPVDECESLAACSTLGEEECVQRSDCDGLYQGVDCTCVGDVCSCTSWLFDGCETAA
jgi:hypothetical protein